MYYQQYLGKFSISSANNQFSVGGVGLTLTSGDYYTAGYSGESTDQLCEHMQAVIRAGTAHATATVEYSGTTGAVTITLDSSEALVFTDAPLAAILGFSSTSPGTSDTFTSDQTPRYVWRPSLGPSEYSGNLLNWWSPRTTTRSYRSASGITFSNVGNLLYDAKISYSLLSVDEVRTPTTGTVYDDLEQWFKDVIHNGMPFRCYPDRTVNTSSDYYTAMFGSDDTDIVDSFDKYCDKYSTDYNGLWDVALPMMEHNE